MNKKHNYAVVLCCDEAHLPLAAFVAERIRRLEPDRRFDLVICVPLEVIVPEYIDKKVVTIKHIDVESFSHLGLQRKWISVATFYRILLPELFQGVYKKLLYLDTDTYPRRGCIQELFDASSADDRLAACLEPSQFLLRRQDKSHRTTQLRIEQLGSEDGRYFNAGLLLIDPAAFIKSNGVERFWEAYKHNLEAISTFGEQDQGAINKAFADDMAEISPLLNWHTGVLLNKTMVNKYDPAILHFAGRYKPWNINDDPFLKSYTDEYVKFFEENSIPFELLPALNSFEYRRQNPKYTSRILNWGSRHLYLRRRRRLQRMSEFEDISYKNREIQKLIGRADFGTK